MNGDVIYTTLSACSQGFPTDDLVFKKLRNALGVSLGADSGTATDIDPYQAPACSVEDGPDGDAEGQRKE